MAEDRRCFSRRWPYLTTLYNTSSLAWKNYFDMENYMPRFSPRPTPGHDDTFETCDGVFRTCHFSDGPRKDLHFSEGPTRDKFPLRSIFPVSRAYSCDGRSFKTGSVLSDRVFHTRSRVVCLAVFIIFSIIAALVGAIVVAVHLTNPSSYSNLHHYAPRRCESFYSRVNLVKLSSKNFTAEEIANKFSRQMEYVYGNATTVGTAKLCNVSSTAVQRVSRNKFSVWFRLGYRPGKTQHFRPKSVAMRLTTLIRSRINGTVIPEVFLVNIERFHHESKVRSKPNTLMSLNDKKQLINLNVDHGNQIATASTDIARTVFGDSGAERGAVPDLWMKPPSLQHTLSSRLPNEPSEFQDGPRQPSIQPTHTQDNYYNIQSSHLSPGILVENNLGVPLPIANSNQMTSPNENMLGLNTPLHQAFLPNEPLSTDTNIMTDPGSFVNAQHTPATDHSYPFVHFANTGEPVQTFLTQTNHLSQNPNQEPMNGLLNNVPIAHGVPSPQSNMQQVGMANTTPSFVTVNNPIEYPQNRHTNQMPKSPLESITENHFPQLPLEGHTFLPSQQQPISDGHGQNSVGVITPQHKIHPHTYGDIQPSIDILPQNTNSVRNQNNMEQSNILQPQNSIDQQNAIQTQNGWQNNVRSQNSMPQSMSLPEIPNVLNSQTPQNMDANPSQNLLQTLNSVGSQNIMPQPLPMQPLPELPNILNPRTPPDMNASPSHNLLQMQNYVGSQHIMPQSLHLQPLPELPNILNPRMPPDMNASPSHNLLQMQNYVVSQNIMPQSLPMQPLPELPNILNPRTPPDMNASPSHNLLQMQNYVGSQHMMPQPMPLQPLPELPNILNPRTPPDMNASPSQNLLQMQNYFSSQNIMPQSLSIQPLPELPNALNPQMPHDMNAYPSQILLPNHNTIQSFQSPVLDQNAMQAPWQMHNSLQQHSQNQLQNSNQFQVPIEQLDIIQPQHDPTTRRQTDRIMQINQEYITQPTSFNANQYPLEPEQATQNMGTLQLQSTSLPDQNTMQTLQQYAMLALQQIQQQEQQHYNPNGIQAMNQVGAPIVNMPTLENVPRPPRHESAIPNMANTGLGTPNLLIPQAMTLTELVVNGKTQQPIVHNKVVSPHNVSVTYRSLVESSSNRDIDKISKHNEVKSHIKPIVHHKSKINHTYAVQPHPSIMDNTKANLTLDNVLNNTPGQTVEPTIVQSLSRYKTAEARKGAYNRTPKLTSAHSQNTTNKNIPVKHTAIYLHPNNQDPFNKLLNDVKIINAGSKSVLNSVANVTNIRKLRPEPVRLKRAYRTVFRNVVALPKHRVIQEVASNAKPYLQTLFEKLPASKFGRTVGAVKKPDPFAGGKTLASTFVEKSTPRSNRFFTATATQLKRKNSATYQPNVPRTGFPFGVNQPTNSLHSHNMSVTLTSRAMTGPTKMSIAPKRRIPLITIKLKLDQPISTKPMNKQTNRINNSKTVNKPKMNKNSRNEPGRINTLKDRVQHNRHNIQNTNNVNRPVKLQYDVRETSQNQPKIQNELNVYPPNNPPHDVRKTPRNIPSKYNAGIPVNPRYDVRKTSKNQSNLIKDYNVNRRVNSQYDARQPNTNRNNIRNELNVNNQVNRQYKSSQKQPNGQNKYYVKHRENTQYYVRKTSENKPNVQYKYNIEQPMNRQNDVRKSNHIQPDIQNEHTARHPVNSQYDERQTSKNQPNVQNEYNVKHPVTPQYNIRKTKKNKSNILNEYIGEQPANTQQDVRKTSRNQPSVKNEYIVQQINPQYDVRRTSKNQLNVRNEYKVKQRANPQYDVGRTNKNQSPVRKEYNTDQQVNPQYDVRRTNNNQPSIKSDYNVRHPSNPQYDARTTEKNQPSIKRDYNVGQPSNPQYDVRTTNKNQPNIKSDYNFRQPSNPQYNLRSTNTNQLNNINEYRVEQQVNPQYDVRRMTTNHPNVRTEFNTEQQVRTQYDVRKTSKNQPDMRNDYKVEQQMNKQYDVRRKTKNKPNVRNEFNTEQQVRTLYDVRKTSKNQPDIRNEYNVDHQVNPQYDVRRTSKNQPNVRNEINTEQHLRTQYDVPIARENQRKVRTEYIVDQRVNPQYDVSRTTKNQPNIINEYTVDQQASTQYDVRRTSKNQSSIKNDYNVGQTSNPQYDVRKTITNQPNIQNKYIVEQAANPQYNVRKTSESQPNVINEYNVDQQVNPQFDVRKTSKNQLNIQNEYNVGQRENRQYNARKSITNQSNINNKYNVGLSMSRQHDVRKASKGQPENQNQIGISQRIKPRFDKNRITQNQSIKQNEISLNRQMKLPSNVNLYEPNEHPHKGINKFINNQPTNPRSDVRKIIQNQPNIQNEYNYIRSTNARSNVRKITPNQPINQLPKPRSNPTSNNQHNVDRPTNPRSDIYKIIQNQRNVQYGIKANQRTNEVSDLHSMNTNQYILRNQKSVTYPLNSPYDSITMNPNVVRATFPVISQYDVNKVSTNQHDVPSAIIVDYHVDPQYYPHKANTNQPHVQSEIGSTYPLNAHYDVHGININQPNIQNNMGVNYPTNAQYRVHETNLNQPNVQNELNVEPAVNSNSGIYIQSPMLDSYYENTATQPDTLHLLDTPTFVEPTQSPNQYPNQFPVEVLPGLTELDQQLSELALIQKQLVDINQTIAHRMAEKQMQLENMRLGNSLQSFSQQLIDPSLNQQIQPHVSDQNPPKNTMKQTIHDVINQLMPVINRGNNAMNQLTGGGYGGGRIPVLQYHNTVHATSRNHSGPVLPPSIQPKRAETKIRLPNAPSIVVNQPKNEPQLAKNDAHPHITPEKSTVKPVRSESPVPKLPSSLIPSKPKPKIDYFKPPLRKQNKTHSTSNNQFTLINNKALVIKKLNTTIDTMSNSNDARPYKSVIQTRTKQSNVNNQITNKVKSNSPVIQNQNQMIGNNDIPNTNIKQNNNTPQKTNNVLNSASTSISKVNPSYSLTPPVSKGKPTGNNQNPQIIPQMSNQQIKQNTTIAKTPSIKPAPPVQPVRNRSRSRLQGSGNKPIGSSVTTAAPLITTFASSLDFPWDVFVPGLDPHSPLGNVPLNSYYDVPPIY